MIYLLFGNDTSKSRDKLSKLVATLLSKKPDAMLVRADSDTFEEEFLFEHTESQGLFETNSIVVFDTVFENEVYKSLVLKSLKDLEASTNVFIILEGKLDKKTLDRISKHAAKVQEFSTPTVKNKNGGFNIFELGDALGERNRKKLWVIYQEGRMNNCKEEEMHGIAFWSVKSMMLASNAKDATSSGLSPFLYRKASTQAKNYKEDELFNISTELVKMYHEARLGEDPLDIAFERFILNLK